MFDRTTAYLAIVECTFDCNVVDIGVRHCCHLCFLDRRNTTFGVKNKDGDVGFVSETVNRSTFLSSINIIQKKPVKKGKSTHLPVSPLVAPTTVNFSNFSPGVFRAFLRSKKNSNKFPSSWSATSLKANVGP